VTTRLERPPDAQTVACPCRHGDVPAETAGQRPLLERAAAGDREAFARLYDGQVEGVYRYLLAWTGDRSAARDLTEQVFRGALTWLPVTVGGEGEAGAWLIAMARDAIVQQRGSGWVTGPTGGAATTTPNPSGPVERQALPRDAVAALALLGDPEREVVVLRLLLGHSLAHTAHLSGYRQRAVIELQLAACLTIAELTGLASPMGADGFGAAEEFERRLGRWEIDLTASDPAEAQALAVAASLRSAIPGYLVAPDDSFVQGLRRQLVAAAAPEPPGGGGSALRSAERAVVAARSKVSRRPWVATFVATAGIVGVLALQAVGSPVPPSTCGGRPCPAPTTVEAAGGGGLGTPLTTIREPATTSSTPRGLPPPTAPRAAAATTPPTTRPVTTAPQTTRPRPTTTRAPTTTAPPTTAPPTTTTAPPVTT
jgi:DNA-directed RNA polymerase specialized sigma24 family protein